MASEFSVVTQSHVTLTIQSEGKEYGVEKRYAKDILIGEFKNKLEMITGLVASEMKLRLLNRDKTFVCDIEPDDRMLGYFPVEDGWTVLVSGSKTVLAFDDESAVKKFELSEEEYARRKNTVKEFKEKNKLGRFSEENKDQTQRKEEQAKQKIEAEKKATEEMKVDSRCQVKIPGAPTRLGTVMYLGELQGKPGYFVGIKYDEPLGKNDGSVDGKRYFQCPPNYGGFVKPEFVTVGDFPEENFDEI